MTNLLPSTGLGRLAFLLVGFAAVGIGLFLANSASQNGDDDPNPTTSTDEEQLRKRRLVNPLRYAPQNARSIAWWDAIPEQIRVGATETGPESNIHPADYAGPDSCKKCHQKNYDSWSKHPHRWMNAMATEEIVVGDFSGDGGISHLGGRAEFFRKDDSFRMTTERGNHSREYLITQTIGSRFFQYYIGRQVKGEAPKGKPTYERDHVLPFGYWIDPGEWVPVVHVYPSDDFADGERTDPFTADFPRAFPDYAVSCNHCHTTFAAADQLVRIPDAVSRHAPMPMHFSVATYFAESHPELWDHSEHTSTVDAAGLLNLINTFEKYEAPEHAVTLGISCEACHLGCKEHAGNPQTMPTFFPQSQHLLVETGGRKIETDRTHANVNWACGRCHAGSRPQYAATMSTWNSTEYTDATRGACYSQLKCIDCHNPHEATGAKWKNTPVQDDALCLRCHDHLEPEAARGAHTHHPIGSTGSRCMDCHMPRLNEGLQDVVRTHTITSPTDPRMIESNEPNACNMCHTEKPIDWTLSHLKEWFETTYDEEKIKTSYPHRDGPVALGWLKSEKPHVRLIGADSLFRTKSQWATTELAGTLDDPYLINRQFNRIGIEELFGVKLADFGFQFYMTPEERRSPIAKVRKYLKTLPAAAVTTPVQSNREPEPKQP